MSLVYSRDDVTEKALYGICDQSKERRRSRLREQRDELLSALKHAVNQWELWRNESMGSCFPDPGGIARTRALIARIEKGTP